MNIEVNKVVAFRPTEYDVRVLKMIAEAHPELPDMGDLLRKALREYQIARTDGGGTKVKASGMAKVLYELVALVKAVLGDINYIKAKIDKCESVEEAN